MTQLLTCKICLLSFDDGERQVQVGDDGDVPLKTLSFKLVSIGFFQDGAQSAAPCQLCSWCAARVEDAYDLQQQCLKASEALKENGAVKSVKEPATVEALLEEVTNLDIGSLPSLTKSILPDLIRISQKGNARTVSNVLTGAHDMFICVRNLSASLKLNATLLKNAVQFTETTLSFITVLLTMNEDSAAIKKSAETMRKEAKMWRVKSAMVSDATSFVECVSSPPITPTKRQLQRPTDLSKCVEQSQKGAEENVQDAQDLQDIETILLEDGEDSQRDAGNPQQGAEDFQQGVEDQQKDAKDLRKDAEIFQQDNENIQDKAEDLQQITGEFYESVKTEPQQQSGLYATYSWVGCPLGTTSNNLDEVLEDNGASESPEEQSVRRSLRSRSMVDTLVYWPKFKKRTSAGERPLLPKPAASPQTSPQALGCLVLRRDPDSESDSGSNEKWAIVKKRKSPGEHGSRKSIPNFGTGSGVPAPHCTAGQSSESLQNGIKEEECSIRKVEDLKNNINEQFHKTIKSKCPNNNAEVLSCNNNNSAERRNEEGSDGYYTDTKDPSLVKEVSPTSRTCNICGKTLKCNRNLQAHMNMHTGSSPYQCSFCPKLFTSSWNRIQHERVHTGMKPYKCDLCEEAFRYNVSLRHHKMKVH